MRAIVLNLPLRHSQFQTNQIAPLAPQDTPQYYPIWCKQNHRPLDKKIQSTAGRYLAAHVEIRPHPQGQAAPAHNSQPKGNFRTFLL